jgi:hypothetical protein
MDIDDRWHEADRLDAGSVRESRGAVDQGEPRDWRSVKAEQIEGLVRAIDVRRADEWSGRLLHLDDHRQERKRMRLHQCEERGVDLLRRGRFRASRWRRR